MSLPTSIAAGQYSRANHRTYHELLHAMYNALWGDYATVNALYVNTTGNDTTGDGLTSGTPFATLAKAISVLPKRFNQAVTINVDGSSAKTYAEAIDVRGIVNTRSNMLIITGNTGTPNNVDFTGTVTATRDDDWSGSTVALIEGDNLWVTLQGLRCSIPNGGEQQIAVRHGAYVKIDRCNGRAATGTCNDAVTAADNATVEFKGNCTFSNWTRWGVDLTWGSNGRFTSAGTLTLTSGATHSTSTAYGIHIFSQSRFITYTPSCNITITGVQYGVQLGLHGLFQHQGATSTLSVTNTATPGSSAVCLATDHSSFSMSGVITADHLTYFAWINSISYFEHSKFGGAADGRNQTNITNGSTSINGSQQSASLIDSTAINYPA